MVLLPEENCIERTGFCYAVRSMLWLASDYQQIMEGLQTQAEGTPMPESSDQVIQHAREVRQQQIQACSARAAKKILRGCRSAQN